MTTMIPYWYGKPREFYDSPSFINMSHATARLYDFLFWMSDRRSSRKFDVLDEDITERTTLAKRTLALARKDLTERRLIVCNRLPRGYSYVICDPSTGEPFPGDPKAKVIPKKKPSNAAPAPAPAAVTPSAVPTKTTTDTDFPFGHNLTPQPQLLRPDGQRDYGFDKRF